MTSKASRIALIAGVGMASASAAFVAAVLLTAPAAQSPSPAPVQAAAPAVAPAETLPAEAAPALPTFANIDPAAFGVLPASMSSTPLPPLRGAMLENASPLPLSSMSSLQSIGATFADPVASGMPQLGGASALDGPADAGLEERVAQSAVAPQAPPTPKGKIIVLDASEGTKLDPLRQRNWDLNAVQVIPPSVPTTQR